MNTKFNRLTEEFASRKHLSRKVGIDYLSDLDRPRLYCDNPAIIARFATQIKQEAKKVWGSSARVLLRGQDSNYPGMIPGIFRDPCYNMNGDLLVNLETEFIHSVRERLSSFDRFNRPYLSSLLQHYGIRTTWIDVVDNLWVATWFASNIIAPPNKEKRIVKPTSNKTGWIYFMSPNACQKNAKCIDLRDTHQGLSLRPHTQHGWSIRGPKGLENNLGDYVIATVEFPIKSTWELSGNLWSPNYLFPPQLLDDTLRRLLSNNINDMARCIETKFGVPVGTLGTIFSVGS